MLAVKFFKAIFIGERAGMLYFKKGKIQRRGGPLAISNFQPKTFYMTVFTTIINSETLQKRSEMHFTSCIRKIDLLKANKKGLK